MMIVYNITTKVHASIDADWLAWQQEELVPEMMASGFFISHRLLLLLEQDDSEGKTYAVQYTAGNGQSFLRQRKAYTALLQEKAWIKWGDKTVSFDSVLELVQE